VRLRRLLTRLPIRAKLTLAYSTVIAVMLGGVGLFLFLNFKEGLDSGLNDTLRTRADDVGALLRQEGTRGLATRHDLLARGDLTAQVIRPSSGRVLVASRREGEPPLLTPTEAREATPGTHYIDRGERERLLVRRGRAAEAPVLVVEASLDQRERALELLNGGLLVGGALTLVLAALAGYGLAGAALRPMETMRRAAARITDAEPHARLPLPTAEDEIHRLGVTLNLMLDRIETARDRERTFVSDASHELRTPLAILKTEVEVALRTDNPPEALRAALRVAGEEADRLTQLAEDLLLVARSDAGRIDLEVQPVPAQDLLEHVARRFRIRARERNRELVIEPSGPLSVAADGPRTEQALSNLVDNALRHGVGTITLRAEAANGSVELHVTDDGPGLPTEFVPHAFERFSRADNGRTGGGSGLGLSIVELIAAAHGGRAGVGNRADGPGADAWLRLPIA
jgi:two-component system, OmpR family, sensor kinase